MFLQSNKDVEQLVILQKILNGWCFLALSVLCVSPKIAGYHEVFEVLPCLCQFHETP